MNKWWHDAVVYQVYPRSFYDHNNDGIGDLQGIISKLDYLQKLGINVLWLSPVYQSPMDDNGYDISDYQDIAAEFGTMDDMRNLIAQAKQRGIGIIMDLVVNHTSDEHDWFKQACMGRDNPYRNHYIWRDPKADGSAPDQQGSLFGGSAWQFDEVSGQYFFHLFSKRQPDLNWQNPEVQAKIHAMMNWWIAEGIAGFRLDVIDLIGKDIDKGITGNGPDLHPLLQAMHKATFAGKDLLTVGETWGATPEIAKLFSAPERQELSMVFQFEHVTLTWKDGDKWQPTDLNLLEFKQVLTKWQVELADQGWNSLFWNNHDLPRVVSKYGDVDNYRIESAKMLATTLHMLKGTPYIYQGEEIGMTNVAFESIDDYRDIETLNLYQHKLANGTTHHDMMAAIHQNSRDNARTPMQWNSEQQAGFTEGEPWIKLNSNYHEINVEQALSNGNSIFYHYQKLIQLRKTYPVIVHGDFTPVFEHHEQVFAYLRQYQEQQLLVINNFSAQYLTLALPQELQNRACHCLVENYLPHQALGTVISLKPYESFALLL